MGVAAMTLSSQLRAIDLGETPAPAGAPLDETAAGAVAGGAVIAFGAALSGQHRLDVVHSLLFGQLAASARADRHSQWTEWYDEFGRVVERIGYVRGIESKARQWEAAGPFPYTAPVLELFTEYAGDFARMRVQDVLSALGADPAAQATFETACRSGGLGNLQVVIADAEDDTVRLRLAQCVFQAPEHVTRLVADPLPRGTRFWTRYADLMLDERAYAAGRATIEQRLGERRTTMVTAFAPAGIPEVPGPDDAEAELDYDPADPFGDLALELAELTDTDRLEGWGDSVVDTMLVDQPGASIRLTETLTVDRDRLTIVLQTPNNITWWKSITLYAVRVPPGQDPQQFVKNVQFLTRHTEPRSLREYAAALTDPNAQLLGRIETKDLTHQATFRVEPWMLDGNELHLEFHKAGFLGVAAYIPIEFWVRGGKGKQYTFTWQRD